MSQTAAVTLSLTGRKYLQIRMKEYQYQCNTHEIKYFNNNLKQNRTNTHTHAHTYSDEIR